MFPWLLHNFVSIMKKTTTFNPPRIYHKQQVGDVQGTSLTLCISLFPRQSTGSPKKDAYINIHTIIPYHKKYNFLSNNSKLLILHLHYKLSTK